MVKIKRIISLLLAFALVLTLAGCGSRGEDASTSAEGDSSLEDILEQPPVEEEKETVRPFALGYYASVGINPYTCDNSQNQTIVGLVYEPLFAMDRSFQPTACLAKSISVECSKTMVIPKAEEEEDNQTATTSKKKQTKPAKPTEIDIVTATVKLREDVKFSDGSSVTASDVAYSLNQARAKGSVYESRLSKLDSVTASGSHVTLVFHSGNTSVAALLDIPVVKSGTGGEKIPVGTGPYKVKLKEGKPQKLVRNGKWWQHGKTYTAVAEADPSETSGNADAVELNTVTGTIDYPLQEIALYTANDSEDLIFGYSSGTVSMVSTDITGTDSLGFSSSGDLFDYDTTDMLYLGFNTAKGPCASEELRSAIYRSVDRETVARKSFAGHAVAACLPVSPKSSLYHKKLAKSLDYDLQTAKELCKEARPGSKLDLIVNNDSVFKVGAAREIEIQLEEAGLDIHVETMGWSDFKAALKSGDYDLYLGEVKLSGNFDMAAFLEKGGRLNFSKYTSKELSARLEQMYAATGEERAKTAGKLYKQIAAEAPFAPLCFKEFSVFAQKGVLRHIYPTQSNLFNEFYRWQISDEVLETVNKSE